MSPSTALGGLPRTKEKRGGTTQNARPKSRSFARLSGSAHPSRSLCRPILISGAGISLEPVPSSVLLPHRSEKDESPSFLFHYVFAVVVVTTVENYSNRSCCVREQGRNSILRENGPCDPAIFYRMVVYY